MLLKYLKSNKIPMLHSIDETLTHAYFSGRTFKQQFGRHVLSLSFCNVLFFEDSFFLRSDAVSLGV